MSTPSRITEEGRKTLLERCRKVLKESPGVTVAELVRWELQPYFPGGAFRDEEERAEVTAIAKDAKAGRFQGKKGKRSAHPVNPLAVQRVRLRNYPEYQIDEHGAVYELDGKLVKPRWRNQRCWVRIYDHEGIRRERNVYWLMVDAGYVTARKPDPDPEN